MAVRMRAGSGSAVNPVAAHRRTIGTVTSRPSVNAASATGPTVRRAAAGHRLTGRPTATTSNRTGCRSAARTSSCRNAGAVAAVTATTVGARRTTSASQLLLASTTVGSQHTSITVKPASHSAGGGTSGTLCAMSVQRSRTTPLRRPRLHPEPSTPNSASAAAAKPEAAGGQHSTTRDRSHRWPQL